MTITIKRPSSPMATNFRPAKEVGEAGEKTSAFEMVSPPRKRLN